LDFAGWSLRFHPASLGMTELVVWRGGVGDEGDVRIECQASVPRDAFPPTPPGPEGSNGNGLLRVQWVSGAWLEKTGFGALGLEFLALSVGRLAWSYVLQPSPFFLRPFRAFLIFPLSLARLTSVPSLAGLAVVPPLAPCTHVPGFHMPPLRGWKRFPLHFFFNIEF